VNEWLTLTAQALAEQLRRGELQPSDVLRALAARIADINPLVHAYIEADLESALTRAAVLERGPRRGKLYGVPIGVKDNICVAGRETACASRILAGFRAPYAATVIQRLEAEGAVMFGRLNMDEFAFGSSTETSAYGITKNPWDLDRIPGGSSGGSAAAVAADCAFACLGSDTGGSIRQPAALCGVVGLKPTYGRVSRYGLIAFASSLDQIGPLTKDVTDAALLLEVIAGHDPADSTSAPLEVPSYTQHLTASVEGLRIGIPQEYLGAGLDPEVKAALAAAGQQLEQLGMRCEPVTMPHTPSAIATYYLIATAEASSNLARYDGVQYGLRVTDGTGTTLRAMYEQTRAQGLGAEAKRRILLGTYALSRGYYEAYYLKALKVRTLIKQDFDRAFERYDCLLTPTSPTPAFRIGERIHDPLSMYLSDICTISANLAGVPALSLPCGLTRDGLPLGMQLLGRPFEEARLLQIAYAYEQATAWHTKHPEAVAHA